MGAAISTPPSSRANPVPLEQSKPGFSRATGGTSSLSRLQWEPMSRDARVAWVLENQAGKCDLCGRFFRLGGPAKWQVDDFRNPRDEDFPVFEHRSRAATRAKRWQDSVDNPELFRAIVHQRCRSNIHNVERNPDYRIPFWTRRQCNDYLARHAAQHVLYEFVPE